MTFVSLLTLLQFRGRIQDILPSLPAQHDQYLLRWLRGESGSTVHHSDCLLSMSSLWVRYWQTTVGPLPQLNRLDGKDGGYQVITL
uniref:Uncharacterized protein n=1 Tax=Monopterus albus TaxID=43700 RepID=A0A3Q3JB21_MONAL